jgi:stage III sporulation protein AD
MSGILFKMSGVALMSAMLIAVLRRMGSELSVMLKAVSGVAVAAVCLLAISPAVELVREIAALSESAASYAEFMLRVLSVAIMTHVCATVCRDCGEGSLGSYVELGGKVEIIVLSLPYIKGIMESAVGMM